ncbi:hypothetical protein [Prauserella cavernicola]|uniref:Uncharacterized protein n=1 Tax=Prauserella cavernicola TaxID=2800127 RepID=A0A934QX31_9PSEU|nr:hypothetical protein [Prauserella cavernicola]MBK1786884.1 hypothetical protein [Prauserella cavernicola]
MTNPDWWQTPQIREAMAKLEEAEVGLDQTIADAKQMERQLPQTGLSQQDVEQIEAHARSKDAPRELRELQERVDRGDLSWNDIAAGRFMDDPQVRSALENGVEGMRQAYSMIQEGHELDDIIEPGGPPIATDAPPREPRPSRPGGDPEDDDYFGGSIMKRD